MIGKKISNFINFMIVEYYIVAYDLGGTNGAGKWREVTIVVRSPPMRDHLLL